jgi:hypothetical protein
MKDGALAVFPLELSVHAVEDEEHFLCHCPIYSKLRNKLLSNDKLGLNNELSIQ